MGTMLSSTEAAPLLLAAEQRSTEKDKNTVVFIITGVSCVCMWKCIQIILLTHSLTQPIIYKYKYHLEVTQESQMEYYSPCEN